MGEHTRGPWTVRRWSGGDRIDIVDRDGEDIAKRVRAVDAELIAAAPDLLQVVEDAEYALGNVIKPECWRDYEDMKVWAESMFLPAARAALAKVRGVLPSSHST